MRSVNNPPRKVHSQQQVQQVLQQQQQQQQAARSVSMALHDNTAQHRQHGLDQLAPPPPQTHTPSTWLLACILYCIYYRALPGCLCVASRWGVRPPCNLQKKISTMYTHIPRHTCSTGMRISRTLL